MTIALHCSQRDAPVLFKVPHLTHPRENFGGICLRVAVYACTPQLLPDLLILAYALYCVVVMCGEIPSVRFDLDGLQLFPVLFDGLENVCAFHWFLSLSG